MSQHRAALAVLDLAIADPQSRPEAHVMLGAIDGHGFRMWLQAALVQYRRTPARIPWARDHQVAMWQRRIAYLSALLASRQLHDLHAISDEEDDPWADIPF